MDYYSPPQDMGLTQVSELKDEEVPEDPHGLLYSPLKIWASPR
jgi:hypothetical protein